MTRRLLTLIAAILGSLLSGCSGEPEVGVTAPVISLARIGTIGDFPPADETTEISVDADGVIRINGEEIALDALPAHLAPIADRVRPEPCCPSDRYVVLRLDRTLPWGVAQWLMQACAHPDVRIYRIHFAVLPEGDGEEEGTLAAHQPTNHGLSLLRRGDRFWRGRIRVEATGSGLDPADLSARIKADRESGFIDSWLPFSEPYDVVVDRHVPVGAMLRVAEVVRGVWRLRGSLAGASDPAGEDAVADLVRETRGMKMTPTIRTQFDDGSGEFRFEDLPPDDRPPDVVARVEAVLWGLLWLRHHQHEDGRWDCDGFEAQCMLNRCGGAGAADHDVAVTGLALLAFVGVGATHIHDGPEPPASHNVVRRGLRWLKSIQDDEGRFGPGTTLDDHAIATWALALVYSRTDSVLFRASAQKAIDFIVAKRKAGAPASSWMLIALKTAKESGKLTVPQESLEGVDTWREMLPAGSLESPLKLDDMPAMFLAAAAKRETGVVAWKPWNAMMTKVILEYRREDGDQRGSWNPVGEWGREYGRIGATALMTLCLELDFNHGRIWR